LFNKSRIYQQVEDFHRTFGHPTGGHTLNNPNDTKTLQGRLDFIAEEFFELLTSIVGEEHVKPVSDAYHNNIKVTPDSPRDVIEFTDALADLVFLIYGTAIIYNIPLDDVLDEVYSSNMSKLDENGNPIYREDGKIMKSHLFTPPRIKVVLDAKGALYQQPNHNSGDTHA
jgi:hypothetical protein